MKTALLTAGALALSVSVATAQDYSAPFTSYFAFGDSLTDNGKFGELAPPSLNGRFSNGITYAEHIAADFQATGRFNFNFALGGATALDANANISSYPEEALPFANFGAQIGTFSAVTAQFEGLGGSIGDAPLVSVLFGGNDLLQNFTTNPMIGTEAANAVKSGIEALALVDDRLDTFVVGNLGDLGATPLFSGTPLESLATAASAQFDAQLAANIDMLRDGGLTIIEFDLAALNERIFADPGAFGIANIEEPCVQSFTSFELGDPNCSIDPQSGEVDITLADPFFFADEVHPNRIVQALAADEFRAAVAAVPLPAGLPLLLTGLGLFGVLRLRRAA